MLVLSRRKDETIIIGDGENAVTVMLVSIDGSKAKIGVQAPPEMPIHRGEIAEEIKSQGRVDLLSRKHLVEAIADVLERMQSLCLRLGPSNEALQRSLATDLIQMAQRLAPAMRIGE